MIIIGKESVKHFQNGHEKIADKIDKLIREFEVRNVKQDLKDP